MNEDQIKYRKKLNRTERIAGFIDILIGLLLAIITAGSIPSIFQSITILLGLEKSPDADTAYCILWITLLLAVVLAILYCWKLKAIRRYRIDKIVFLRASKINEINQNLFDSLYAINGAKTRSIFRHTYGNVPHWNPIDYLDNILVYDIHEHIRTILTNIKSSIIRLDSERFNDRNVSVELVYCYPQDQEASGKEGGDGTSIPIDHVSSDDAEHPWKLISSGDASGNRSRILDHLSENNSFFTLLDCCGTVLKNNKYQDILKYQAKAVKRHLKLQENENPPTNTFFISDVRDEERTHAGTMDGSAIGTVIVIRNDNPEEMFVKAILTINTYGEPIFKPETQVGNKMKLFRKSFCKKKISLTDKFGLTEEDYHRIIIGSVLATYSKLLESELSQMYIRHGIRDGYICPRTGGATPKAEVRSENLRAEALQNKCNQFSQRKCCVTCAENKNNQMHHWICPLYSECTSMKGLSEN